MSSALQNLKSKWLAASLRVRWSMLTLVVFIIFYFCYTNIWYVAKDFYSSNQIDFQSALRLEQQVELLAESGLFDEDANGQDLNLISLISSTADESNITISRMVPSQDNSSVLINIEQTEFGRLMQLLESVERQGIEIATLSVESSAQEGYISARASLGIKGVRLD